MHSEPLDRGLSLNSSLNFNLVYCSEIKMNSCRVYLETRPAILFLLPVSYKLSTLKQAKARVYAIHIKDVS